MTSLDYPTQPGLRSSALPILAPLFTATIFLSAVLLFCLEPMFSKMVLPILGGSSAVWSTAMVVFQGLLLAGYLYAHLLTSHLPPGKAVILHMAVLALGVLSLPIAVAAQFAFPPDNHVALWTVGLFLVSVGLPCFAISASAPLLQAWFARSGHEDAANPYFLYRASNAGSFAVLLLYPFLIEPTLGLSQQSHWWSFGYAALAAFILACGLLVARRRSSTGTTAQAVAPSAVVDWTTRWKWIALGFIPSGLLIAVTADISTDVASAPFLWIVPLALYLLTYVVAFTDRPILPMRTLLYLLPVAAGMLGFLFLWGSRLSWAISLPCHLVSFFIISTLCQTRLYEMRPPASGLTGFYLWMSAGGVLGGIFAALLAPQLFSTVLEYPLLALAAIAVHPGLWRSTRQEWKSETAFIAVLAVAMLVPFLWLRWHGNANVLAYYAIAIMLLALFMGAQWERPVRLLLLATGVFGLTSLYDPSQNTVMRARSFYAAYKVFDVNNGKFRVLYHGATAHGAEQVRDAQGEWMTNRPDPLSYYYTGGPFSQALDAARKTHGGKLNHVALIGVGMGALSCRSQPGENWTYYELDPLVVRIALDRRLFRSMSLCANHARIVTGDGRLALAKSPQRYDMILLDAFTSDSVPVHLLTREALGLYKSKLAPGGVIAFHISNKNLELASVVGASAAANGMVVVVKRDPNEMDSQRTMKLRAELSIVAQSRTDLKALKLDSGWHPAPPHAIRVWTDDYSDIPGAIWRKFRNG